MCRGRNIEHHPVPPATTRGGIGLIDGQGVTAGTLGRVLPTQGGGDILAITTEAVKYLSLAQGGAGGYF